MIGIRILLRKRTIGRPVDWLEMLRPFSWTATIIPAGLGGILAFHEGAFDRAVFLSVTAGVVLLQGAANMVNEYYDLKTGVDNEKTQHSSRVLVEGRVDPDLVLLVGRMITVLFIVISFLYAHRLDRWGLPAFAALAAGGAYSYTAPPLQLKYRGLGLPSVFFLFGGVLTMAVYYTLTGNVQPDVFWLSLPVAFLVKANLHGNDLRDLDTDQGILTVASLIGMKNSLYFFTGLILIPFFAVVFGILFDLNSLWGLIVFLTLPLAVSILRQGWSGLEEGKKPLKNLDVESAKLHLLFGLLWIAANFF